MKLREHVAKLDWKTEEGRHALLETALAGFALAVAVYAVVTPFVVAPYPPMTDLPEHATQTSPFRHYLDPDFHFREQFVLQPLAVPYLTMYSVGALLSFVLPMVTAVKVAACLMVALVPAGLAVLFHGMKKSPLLGLLGLGVCWCNLTEWGFLSHMGALGLFAATIGCTLLVLDDPTRRRRVALGVTLALVFATHIFRFPFAIAAVVGTGIVMYPSTRRFKPILAPLVPSLVLLAAWYAVRPKQLKTDGTVFKVNTGRFAEFANAMTNSFYDPAERIAFDGFYRIIFYVAIACVVIAVVRFALARRSGAPRPTTREMLWQAGVVVIPLACAAVFLGLFLMLPLDLGGWFYVYPREATATTLIALAAFPDLPKSLALRAPLVGALALATVPTANVVIDNYRKFAPTTEDFTAIVKLIPQAPKLLYLVFDRDGAQRTVPPYIHFPAYVQAEKGGWLSFHFAHLGTTPVAYRPRDEPGAVVPPPVPPRWEWTPQIFDVQKHGAFFDTFLVRSRMSPDARFKADATIEPVAHIGMWWLYRRRP